MEIALVLIVVSLLVFGLSSRGPYGIKIRINCTFNDQGEWCKNENVKRSLWGVGARCCVLYPGLNGMNCQWQKMYPRPTARPPAGALALTNTRMTERPLQEDRGLPPVQQTRPMPSVKSPKVGIQPTEPWPRK